MPDHTLTDAEWEQVRICQRCGHGHMAHWPHMGGERTTACLACLEDPETTHPCDDTGFHIQESALVAIVAAARADERATWVVKIEALAPEMAEAWGRNAPWITSGSKVAALVDDWLRALIAGAES